MRGLCPRTTMKAKAAPVQRLAGVLCYGIPLKVSTKSFSAKLMRSENLMVALQFGVVSLGK